MCNGIRKHGPFYFIFLQGSHFLFLLHTLLTHRIANLLDFTTVNLQLLL
jgi:hypothetical protein